MLEIAAGIAVGGGYQARVGRAQHAQAASLLGAAAIGSSEKSLQAIPVPGDTRADNLIETQGAPDLRHVKIGTRAHQHEPRSRAAVLLQALQRVAMHTVLEDRRHEPCGPLIEPRAIDTSQGGADECGLQGAVIRQAQCEQHQCGNDSEQSCQFAPGADGRAQKIRQQRIAAGDRSIEIENGELRWSGLRGPSAYCVQAARPVAASCRSTYCRIPPCR